ncbi:MAG: non-homologous end-joining DNA ligase [Candidatus Bathyarchaeota archaeon]|nr:MAG: non-homologous end-joining DNA ligase [Candidatus Bathyarchaeota archaeon]
MSETKPPPTGINSTPKSRVKFTNLQKILYPGLRVAKYQVVEYYLNVASRMLRFLAGRPVSMYRFPDGVGEAGFYEKDAPKGKPFWVKTFSRFSETANRTLDYIVCEDTETLAWLANLAALEINITLSTIESYGKPDMVLFDIDPEPPAGFNDAVEVARHLNEKLDLLGFKCYIKTSGKKGLHVALPIAKKYTFRQTRAFVHQMGRILGKEFDLVVSEFSRTKDRGTVFVDYMQNVQGKTMVCPYSLRATKEASVSTPLEWREVKKGLIPEDLNIFSVAKRKTDPWKGFFENQQTLDFT